MTVSSKPIKLGGAAGFIGDSPYGTPQLLQVPDIDYLVYDYLAEVSMGIFARSRSKNPNAPGYAVDFIEVMMRNNLKTIAEKGVKVVANSGVLDPVGCANALRAVIDELGLQLKVAAVYGDNILDRIEEFRAPEMFSGEPLPERLSGANAYFGAVPIARALDRGADIVVTGRISDSALVLGPLMHEFGWKETDYDLLAQGTLAGHLIECGPQVSGGTYTDWFEGSDWSNIGYPIAECYADGRLFITKPEGTGGVVNTKTVSEQTLYEVDDPANYIVGDVIVDLTGVTVHAAGENRVEVRGVRGRQPTDYYKVCATYQKGYRCMALAPVVGVDAGPKAQRQADALIDRNEREIQRAGFDPFTLRHVELLGLEASYGANSRARGAREVVAKIIVDHTNPKALNMFRLDSLSPIVSMAPGSTGWHFGRPSIYPVMQVCSFLAPKSRIPAKIDVDGEEEIIEQWHGGGSVEPERALSVADTSAAENSNGNMRRMRLIDLAVARSGDKGDRFMAAIVARKPEYLPWIKRNLTVPNVMSYMEHVFDGRNGDLTLYDVPGLNALHLLFNNSASGGQLASPRLDALAKGIAQQLLDMVVEVPDTLSVEPYARLHPIEG